MTPGSRIQLLSNLLERFYLEDCPADILLSQCYRKNKFIGGKDRQFLGQHFFNFFRCLGIIKGIFRALGQAPTPLLEVLTYFLIAEKKTLSELLALSSDSPHAFKPLSQSSCRFLESASTFDTTDFLSFAEKNSFPAFLEPLFRKRFGEELETALHALNTEAPLDLRVNTCKNTLSKTLASLQKATAATATPFSPLGIRCASRVPITQLSLYQSGDFDIQDEGSQIVSLLCTADPTMKVLDFCCGAGGKTLALSAQMGNKGRLIACDVNAYKLANAKKRFQRAGLHNIHTHLLQEPHDPWLKRHKRSFDRVLLDVPCSGTGTWRRNSDAKWRLTPKTLDRLLKTQAEILEKGASFVKEAGHLIYATCSILKEENEEQIERFLKKHPDFTPVSIEEIWEQAGLKQTYTGHPFYALFSPHTYGTDGFFATVLKRVSNDVL